MSSPAGTVRRSATSGTAADERRPLRSRRRLSRRVHWSLYLFPLPLLVPYAVFFAIPAIQSFQYAVTDWDGLSPTFNYVGFDNFRRIFTADDLFRNALFNNLEFMLVVLVLQTALSLVLALLLAKQSRAGIALRALFFFPTILSSVSVAFIWRFIYDPTIGLANTLLGDVGLHGLQGPFLGGPNAIIFVGLAQVWAHTGQLMVVYIAGLHQIPQDVKEAAIVDGANRWQRFRYITWSLIAPATAIVMAYTVLQSFRAFDLILGLDQIPPRSTMDILSTRIYTSFAGSEFGYATAESIVFMVIIAIVVWLQRRLVRMTQAGG
ncbi:MAG TPA: sugar ABC transporter permease [Nakamurella sp.]|nr:sugar ABC transporter permease [Nakamurella sp.]